ncbi:hypothetical protein BJ912DRAFT_1025640 [Pholiota molesta]|nr:hypothetical protein BJ912DRAFT_1025640 [Pholiota molesta]
MRLNDKEILKILKEEHIDTETYGLGLNSFRKIRQNIGLERARRQKHTLETIREAVQGLRQLFPLAGAREMTTLLFHERDMCVPRDLVVRYFHVYEPELVRQRKARRLKRRRFWSAGVNDLWAFDQHDKWKRFGLAFHICGDPFPGVTQWLKIWHNNNNPKLICSFYLDRVEKVGYIPLITQSDLGSENYGIANAHTMLRQLHDPRLEGTNVKPEIAWSQFRRRFTPGFESILQEGVTAGWYDTSRPLDVLVFRWLFIPWLQVELDAYVERINNTKKRADRNKVLPHGVPNDIANSPERYGCLDFKVIIDPEAIAFVREKFAPPSDPVFELVPPLFAQYAGQAYAQMGRPALEITMRRANEDEDYIDTVDQWQVTEFLHNQDEEYELPYPLTNGRELFGGFENPREDGSVYLGGVNGGRGLDAELMRRLDDLELESDFEPVEVQGGLVFSEDEADGDDLDGRDEW